MEVLIIDGGSTDGTKRFCESYPDDRVTVLEDGKIVESLNLGISEAKGEFIARVDADTVSETNRFEKQIELLEADQSLGIVGCQLKVIDPDTGSTRIEERASSHETIRRELPIMNSLVHPTWMIRKSVFDTVGGYQNHRWEDYELLTRVIQHYKLKNIEEPLVTEFERHDSIIRSTSAFEATWASLVCGFLATRRSGFGRRDQFRFYVLNVMQAVRRMLRSVVQVCWQLYGK